MPKGPPLYPFPICSYAVVLAVSLMHFYEGAVILHTYCADNNIPIHSLLSAIPSRLGLALWMIVASIPAIVALWKDYPPWLTSLLVVPQGSLLVITAAGAYLAFWHGQYFNFDPGCADFVGTDQIQRAATPFIYAAAVYQLIRESAYNTQIRELDIRNGHGAH